MHRDAARLAVVDAIVSSHDAKLGNYNWRTLRSRNYYHQTAAAPSRPTIAGCPMTVRKRVCHDGVYSPWHTTAELLIKLDAVYFRVLCKISTFGECNVLVVRIYYVILTHLRLLCYWQVGLYISFEYTCCERPFQQRGVLVMKSHECNNAGNKLRLSCSYCHYTTLQFVVC